MTARRWDFKRADPPVNLYDQSLQPSATRWRVWCILLSPVNGVMEEEEYWLRRREDGILSIAKAPVSAQKRESDKPTELLDPPPHKSKVTREDMRYTTLAGAYRTTPAMVISWTPTMLPLPHTNQTPQTPIPMNSGGMMLLEGRAARQVVSSSNDYLRQDFPAETYAHVKRCVNMMTMNPRHKYKANRVVDYSRRFTVFIKQKMMRLRLI